MNCNKKPPLDWHPSPASETISSPVSEVEILRATTIEPSPVFGISEEIPTIHSEERTEGTPALQAKEETFARALPERIPEVVEELLSPTMPLPAESSPINEIFQRLMRELSALTEETDLNSLLPPGCPKTLAARAFMLCLNLAARRVVMLWQSEPYGPIHIRPGPHFSVLIPLQVGDPEFEGEEDDDEDEGEQQEEEEEGGEEQHEEEIEEEGGVEEGYEEEAMDI
uniref:Rad21/Rec8-like protein C-terminal eukaryotic domain-containing protein n=1 Tax=Eptatretus burgeri TaxID=7764 RepID=A0A8C4QCK9_EPTBU